MKRPNRITLKQKMEGISPPADGLNRTIASCTLEDAPDGGKQVGSIRYSDGTILPRAQFTQRIKDQIAFWQRTFNRKIEECDE